MADPNAQTTDLETALRTTAAIREFTNRPVTREDLTRLLDVARFAPSGGNQQAWHVVSIEDPEIRARIGDLIVASAKEYLALAQSGARPFGLSEQGRWPGPGDVDLDAARDAPLDAPVFAALANAPALLAVLVHLPRLAAMDAELDRHGVVAGASIYPFCRDLLLSAPAPPRTRRRACGPTCCSIRWPRRWTWTTRP